MSEEVLSSREIAVLTRTHVRVIQRRAKAEGWPAVACRSRTRFRLVDLPDDIYRALLDDQAMRARARQETETATARSEDLARHWRAYERASNKRRAKADARARFMRRVADLLHAGRRLKAAINEARAGEADASFSERSALRWWVKIKGLPRNQWPALLLSDSNRNAGVAKHRAEVLAWIVKDQLRAERPTVAMSYERCRERITEQHPDWLPMPSLRMVQRHIKRIRADVRALGRDGPEVAERIGPKVVRSVDTVQAMDEWNADGHRLDLFATLPDGKTARPFLVAIQDAGSRMIVGYRVGVSENADLVRLAFCDAIRAYGLPRCVRMDNGRAFAAHKISGGALGRKRWAGSDNEWCGLFHQLDVEARFVTPYRGQAKPIERSFRDLLERIKADDRCKGATTGNDPLNKPQNYGSKAVPWDSLLSVVSDAIEWHNDRPGRTGGKCRGRSFSATFMDDYQSIPIRNASEEQLRLAFLDARPAKVMASARVKLSGNEYFHTELTARIGEMVVLRFDPAQLHRGVYVYSREGQYVCHAAAPTVVGYNNAGDAERVAKEAKALRKRRRELLNDLLVNAPDLPSVSRSLLEDATVTGTPPRSPKPGAVIPIAMERRRKSKQTKFAAGPAKVIDHPTLAPLRRPG